jgi:DNA processing protein
VGPVASEGAARETRAILILQRLQGVGDRGLDPLAARFGSAAAALAAPAREFNPVVSPVAEQRSDPELLRRVDAGLAWCAAHAVTVVHRWQPDYPAQLRSIDNPPGVLFLQGDRALLEREIVTVVGSRKSTEYGRRVAREVAAAAVRGGAVVASGLALGIDGEAHHAALAAEGRTLAVLGAGLARPYPRRHVELFRRIAREGLLISEFLPHEPPLKHNFPRRNRTLAALAKVVVVVEAAEASGALVTARHANDLGKEVLAAPGSIYAPMSRGTNKLLANAHALWSPGTVLDYLSAGSSPPLSLFPPGPPADMGADALRVWDALAESPRHVDALAREAKLAPTATLVALSLLEVGGWIRQEPGARFTRGGV